MPEGTVGAVVGVPNAVALAIGHVPSHVDDTGLLVLRLGVGAVFVVASLALLLTGPGRPSVDALLTGGQSAPRKAPV